MKRRAEQHPWLPRAMADYDARIRAGDEAGSLAIVASALQQLHQEAGAPPEMDPWIDTLDRHLASAGMTVPPELESEIFAAALGVLARRPSHPALPLWLARAQAKLRDATEPDKALRAAHFAFEYALRAGNFALARDLLRQARNHSAGAAASVRIAWLEAEALQAWLAAEHSRARAAVAEALAAGGGYGTWEQGASAALSEGDLAHADVCLAEMARTLDHGRSQDVAHYAFLGGARAALGGDAALAQDRLEACMAVDATRIPAYFGTLWQLGEAHVAVESGKHRRAARALTETLGRATTMYWRFLQFSVLMTRTWLRVREKRNDDALADLRAALALSRTNGYRNCDPWWNPGAMDEIRRFARPRQHDREALDTLLARLPVH